MNFVMETNGGKKTFSNYYPQYKNPLCSKMEDSQPQSGIQKFCNAAYSNAEKNLKVFYIMFLRR